MNGGTGHLKKRIKKGDHLFVGGILDSRSGSVVEMYHDCGFDMVLIDREHSALNSETILEYIRLARALGIASMVRVADHSYHEFNRMLDQAPDAIMIPRIRTRAEVEHVMNTIKYPPLGQRGLAGVACPVARYRGWTKLTDQIAYVNKQLVVCIQIETAEALADLDNILSVPGIDMVLVGNDDLSISMGIPGQLDHPRYIKAVDDVIAACKRHRILPGIAGGDPTWVRYWSDKGMRLFWAAADIVTLWTATRQGMTAIQTSLAAKKSPPSPIARVHY